MIATNKLYDIVKWLVQYLLPGAAALYFALSAIWGLPYADQVVGTIVALSAFLGALVGLASVQFTNDKMQNGYSTLGNDINTVEVSQSIWIIPGNVYDILKWVVMILLPSAGTLYFALAQMWALPYASEIVGTIAAISAFAGILLGISTNKYNQLR